MRLGFRYPRPQKVGLMAWRIFQAVPRRAWVTAREIAEALGDLTAHDVAGAIRGKLIPLYVKKRQNPDEPGGEPPSLPVPESPHVGRHGTPWDAVGHCGTPALCSHYTHPTAGLHV